MTANTANIALLMGNTGNDANIVSGVQGYIDHHRLPWTVNWFIQELESCQLQAAGQVERFDVRFDAIIGFLRTYDGIMADWATGQGVPIVQLAQESLPHQSIVMVRPDDEAIGKMAAEHLIAQGYRHFAYSKREGAKSSRLTAYEAHLKSAGFRCSVIKVNNKGSALASEMDMVRQIKQGPLPLALFFHQDRPALFFMDLCSRHNLRIPEDVAILGVDDVETSRSVTPPMSSIVIPWQHIGKLAAENVHRMLSCVQVVPEQRVLPVRVARRDSTRCPKPTDPMIENILRALERDYAKAVRIADLAQGLKVERTTLYRRFVAVMGHSPSDHLHALRIDKAKELLADTKLSIDAIRKSVGYPNHSNFIDIFKARTGMTPSAFRRSCS